MPILRQRTRPARLVAVALTMAALIFVPELWAQRTVRIGMLFDGPGFNNNEILAQYKSEIASLTRGEFNVLFPEAFVLTADWTVSGIRRAMDRLLIEPEVHVVIALGVIGSHQAATRKNLPKPVIATSVIDAKVQGLPKRGKASGRKNLSYLETFSSFERDIGVFHKLLGFKKLAIIGERVVLEAIPSLRPHVERIAKRSGFSISVVFAIQDADSTLRQIPGDAEAVYVTPLLRFDRPEFVKLIEGINARRLPSFTLYGRDIVQTGVMAGLTSESGNVRFTRLTRRVALNVQRILLGEDAGTFATDFRNPERLLINMKTALAVGYRPSWQVLGDAEIIAAESTAASRTWNVQSVVKAAVDANLDLAAKKRQVRASQENVSIARSGLLPQLDIGANHVVIDQDRAAASLGSQSERTTSSVVTLNQLIYSEKVWAGLSISERQQRIAELEQSQLRLDISLAAAEAYLNFLRAAAFERITENNLSLSRKNLELARLRQAVGSAGKSDLFRWESQVATNRKEVADARSQRLLAAIELNRLLHRPLDEQFDFQDVSPQDPLLLGDPRILSAINDPWGFKVFEDFMVQEGLEFSPELEILDEAVAAQRRQLDSTGRAFWAPTLALQGQYTKRLSESGVGSDDSASPLAGLGFSLPSANDEDWSVALSLSLPLLSGGARLADHAQAREATEQLLVERDATAERVEQGVRAALTNTRASFPGMRFTRQALESARKNLELVTDGYAKGVSSILNLLDAQNAALTADEAASDAVYIFLIDMFRVQRAVGKFDFFRTPQQRDEQFKKMEAFFGKSGIRIKKP